jgi:hypothetical protein
MKTNEGFGETEAFTAVDILATFLAMVDKGGVQEGVAGMYRLLSALPSAVDHYPTAMATIEAWLGREGGGDGPAKN